MMPVATLSRAWIATLLLVTPALGVAQGRLTRPVIDKLPGGATRVMNAGPTRWVDTNGWKLVYERTVQPPEGAPGVLENPWGAVLASDGRLVTLDIQTPAIRLYDPNGRFLRSMGRAGEGPGEYKVAFIALYHDSLFIYDPQLRRATVMTLDGKVVRTVITTANDYFPIYFDARGLMALRVSTRTPEGRKGYWVYHTRTGQRVDSVTALGYLDTKGWKYLTREGMSEWEVPFPPANVMELLPSGGAVYGRTDNYSLVVTHTGDDTLRIFGRLNPPQVRIPETVRDSALQAEIRKQPKLQTVAKKSDLPATYPLWRNLQMDGAGNIWVGARSDRPQQSRFDVFSPDGAFLGTVAAPCNASAKIDFHGDRVTIIDTDADELPRIRIFRIDRRGK